MFVCETTVIPCLFRVFFVKGDWVGHSGRREHSSTHFASWFQIVFFCSSIFEVLSLFWRGSRHLLQVSSLRNLMMLCLFLVYPLECGLEHIMAEELLDLRLLRWRHLWLRYLLHSSPWPRLLIEPLPILGRKLILRNLIGRGCCYSVLTVLLRDHVLAQ